MSIAAFRTAADRIPDAHSCLWHHLCMQFVCHIVGIHAAPASTRAKKNLASQAPQHLIERSSPSVAPNSRHNDWDSREANCSPMHSIWAHTPDRDIPPPSIYQCIAVHPVYQCVAVHRPSASASQHVLAKEEGIPAQVAPDHALVVDIGIKVLPDAGREDVLVALIPPAIHDFRVRRVIVRAFHIRLINLLELLRRAR